MSTTGRVRALRGATTVEHDRAAEVQEATIELLRAILERNHIAPEDVVSAIFTATPDLTSAFPAAAARAIAFDHVPLLCASEIAVTGALPRCIRVLLHVYSSRPASQLHHVYLRGARDLRTDLTHP